MPDSVHLLINETQNVSASGPAIVGAYTYTLTANLRPARLSATEIPNTDNSATAALLTLGGNCPPTSSIDMSNNTTLKVYGDIITNQGPPCVTQGQHTELDYHSISYGNAPNPFPNLQPPSTQGLLSRSGPCNSTAQPGVYAATLVINGTCTLQSGIYILQQGLTLSNNSTLNSAAGGVLLYLPGGLLTVNNNASVNIAAMSSGPYAGLALWQVSNSTIDISNNGLFTIAGTLYAPSAELHFSNNTTTPQITTVIVAAISMKNNSGASFGPAPKALAVGANIPPAWTANAPFTPVQITATGGFGTYLYSISGVPGLSVDSSGLITGSPTSTGNKTLTVTLNDSFNDPQAVATFPITINAGMNITNSSPLPAGNRNVAYSADTHPHRRDRPDVHVGGDSGALSRGAESQRQHGRDLRVRRPKSPPTTLRSR